MDGALGLNSAGLYEGGIGGNVKDISGALCYVFSGPCLISSSTDAELMAILHIVELWIEGRFSLKKIVICSDSREAINLCKLGYHKGFPIQIRN